MSKKGKASSAATARAQLSAHDAALERPPNGANVQSATAERISVPFSLAAVEPNEGAEASNGRREYRIQFISAGRVLRRDGQEADWEIPAETIIAAVQAGLFENLACFIDHVDEGVFDLPKNPSLRSLCGVCYGAEWDAAAQAAVGKLLTYNSAAGQAAVDILDPIIKDKKAGLPVPNVGGSMVFYHRSDFIDVGENPGEEYLRVTTEFKHIESWDIVFGPGREGRVLDILSRLSAARPQLEDGGKKVDEDKVVEVEQPQPDINAIVDAVVARLGAAGASPQPASDAGAAVTGPGAYGLAALEQKVDRILAGLGQREDEIVVEGLGVAPINPANRRIEGGQTGLDRFAPNIDWLFGVAEAPLPDPQFRRADMIYTALSGDYEFRGVFDSERVMLATANVTTLANLAVNAMNKVIVNQFGNMDFWRWYERVVAVTPNDGSLHDMQWITFGGIGNLPTVADGGSYTELTVDDAKEADSFVTKGGYVGITRRMIKNSEIQRIQAVPVALAIACVRTRSATVSAIFTDNSGVGPTLDQDSTALFHANHSNVGTTAFAQAEWRVVRTAIAKHTDVNSGKRLAIFPKYALLPVDLYDTALAVFGYGDGYPTSYTPEAQDRGFGDPRPVPLVVPDWTDTNNWAAVVDPKVYPVIQMSYSQRPGGGAHPPCELFAATSETGGLMFSNDTLPIKVRDEFAVGVNGPRGVYKENVA